MVGLSTLRSLSSLGQTLRGLGLILVSLIHFHQAERCLGLANSFEEENKEEQLEKKKDKKVRMMKKCLFANSCGFFFLS